MGKNCLVTKLKGSITGDAPIFGQLEMIMTEINIAVLQSVSVSTGEESIVFGDNGIVFKDFQQSAEYSNPFTLTPIMQSGFYIICSTNAKMTITNKYKLRATNRGEYGFQGVKEFIGGFDSFVYSIPDDATIVRLEMYQSKIGLSEIVQKVTSYSSSIVNFIFALSPLINGNINAFLDVNNLEGIDVGGCTLVNGTIADLKSITTIKNIACTATQVDGTIEEFVAGQRAAGRITGTVGGNSTGWGKVTFDGATTHAKGAVRWTATTITMDGVTINS